MGGTHTAEKKAGVGGSRRREEGGGRKGVSDYGWDERKVHARCAETSPSPACVTHPLKNLSPQRH